MGPKNLTVHRGSSGHLQRNTVVGDSHLNLREGYSKDRDHLKVLCISRPPMALHFSKDITGSEECDFLGNSLARKRVAKAALQSQGRRNKKIQKLHQGPSSPQHESQWGPYIFQDARRRQPALVQDILWDVIAKLQDVIFPHEHDKLLVVGAERLVSIDESLYEPKQERVPFVFRPIRRAVGSLRSFDSEEAKW